MIHHPSRSRRKIQLALGALMAVGTFGQFTTAQAQLIGNRTVGSAPGNIQQTSPSGRIGAGSFTNAAPGAGPIGANGISVGTNPGGGISQNGRFVRGNRQRGDFVGSNRTDLKGFVGAGQAVGTGNAPSATSSLRLETSGQRVNRPLPPLPKKSMYYPKLVLDQSDSARGEVIRSPEFQGEVQDRLRRSGYPQVAVQWNAGVAVLSGQVATEREREMAETLLGFEPGISEIRNELQVNPFNSSEGDSTRPTVPRSDNRSTKDRITPVTPLPEPVLPRRF